MTTIYIWHPSTILTLGGRDDFYKRNQYSLDKIKKQDENKFVMYHKRDDHLPEYLKIQVFGKKGANTFFRSFGHASIKVEYNEMEVYASFYPNTSKTTDVGLVFPFVSFPSKFQSFDDDVENMQAPPDYAIKIRNLNNASVYRFLTNLSNHWGEYNLYSRNCSTLVMTALQVGAQNANISTWGSVKYSANQFYEKAKEVFGLLMKFAPPSNTFDRNYYYSNWYTWNSVKSDPVKALFGIYETIGGLTPYKAMNYAKFLKDELG